MPSSSRTLSALGEFGWLRKLLPKLYWPSKAHSQLCIGPGDDSGVMRITSGKVLVASTDAMIEGVHFERKWLPWDCLGEKILAVNLSDLAAMGKVEPLAALVTAGFPGDTAVDSVDKFYRGLESCAQRWKTGLLGGDTVGSPDRWFLSVTVFGEARPQDIIRRDTAKPGDVIFTSGPLGLAAAGLEVLQRGKPVPAWTRPLVEAFYHPQPRFKEAALLAKNRWATSLMDCSDGLEASVRLMTEKSGCGVELETDRLPIPRILARWAAARKCDAASYALRGGEDYELIFTARPSAVEKIKKRLPRAAAIGHVLAKGAGRWSVSSRGRTALQSYGFSHFKKK